MPNNFSAFANDGGSKVDLKITQADGTEASMSIPVLDSGFVAISILAAAVDCALKSGKLEQLEEIIDKPTFHLQYVKSVHAIAVRDAPDEPSLVVFDIAVGGTLFCIGVPRELLTPLATGLMAAGAGGTAH